MKSRLFAVGAAIQPFTAGIKEGFTPRQIKEGIIAVLDPYVADKNLLEQAAVDYLAGEAICIARFDDDKTWKEMFEFALAIRQEAIAKDKPRAFEILTFFQDSIIDTQKKYALQINFEVPKKDLELDEFAFETFRNIGSIIESALQPFLKEFYCLMSLSKGLPLKLADVLNADFGKIIENLANILQNTDLIAPKPWNIRLNQWRNIAQHHSFKVSNGCIVAHYGKMSPPKRIEITRSELLSVAVEVNSRLAILRCSRALSILNAGIELISLMSTDTNDISAIATTLMASFATQGFTLVGLEENDGKVTASLIDAAPAIDEHRHIHCSQFIIPIANWFPGRDVEVQLRTQDNQEHWVYFLDREKLARLFALDDPLKGLADAIDWRKSLLLARENERKNSKTDDPRKK